MNENNINSNKLNKLTLKRESSFVGALISFKVYIDDVKVAKISNGETIVLDVTPGQHVISINKMNPTNIDINGDTFADVVIFGANNFGISNINGSGLNQNYLDNNSNNLLAKYKKNSNIYLAVSIIIPMISVVLFFASQRQYLLQFWFYGLVIGYGLVNIFGLNKIKNYNNEIYKISFAKNLIGIAISLMSAIITIMMIDL